MMFEVREAAFSGEDQAVRRNGRQFVCLDCGEVGSVFTSYELALRQGQWHTYEVCDGTRRDETTCATCGAPVGVSCIRCAVCVSVAAYPGLRR